MDEYINRDDLLKATWDKPTLSLSVYDIGNIKPVDVAPVRHGRWISLTDCSNAGVYCSVCHKKVYKEDYAWCNRKNKLRSKYCPNCGAKMDGGAIDGTEPV